MAGKLVEHLARCETGSLVALLGDATAALLKKVGNDAYNKDGLAYLIVSMYGAENALRNKTIRSLLFSNLKGDEGRALCEILGFPTSAVLMTLNGVDFESNTLNLSSLMSWYDVAFDASELTARDVEVSRKAVAKHRLRSHQLTAFRKIRRFIASPDTSVLVHMPFGSGKLRLVATAVLDLYRSEPDGRSIVWLGVGEALCEEAFIELREVWEQIGSRDVTIYRVYGCRPVPDLGNLENCIIVADITKLDDERVELERLGKNTRVVILGDAEHVAHPAGIKIIEGLSKEGTFSLVGMSAVPASALIPIPHQTAFRARFTGSCISVDDEDPVKLLREAGYVGQILSDIRHVKCGVEKFEDDNALEFSAEYLNLLSKDVERNQCLLDLILAESQTSGRVIFFATTAEHARLFAGLLFLRGVKAMSVTSEGSPEDRSRTISQFNIRDAKVLCVHGVFISGDSIPGVSVAVIAMPTLSSAVFLGLVGRLASARNLDSKHLRVVVVSDSAPEQMLLVETLGAWNKLDI
ncbi:TPA: DEAD/DEAH box helicase [Pseudomonas aeruginosa]